VRIALKFGYIGSEFYGYQRQPGVRTVEGDLINACMKVGAFSDIKEAVFQSASRTDRGVHALGNVVAFNTDFPPEELISALNALNDSVLVHSYLSVPASFNPRKAVMRHYRYLLFEPLDMLMLSNTLQYFTGTKDFSPFAKGKGPHSIRSIESIDVRNRDGVITVDIKGRSFLHNMVRRIIAASVSVAKGERDAEELELALKGKKVRSFGLAPPDFLILVDVHYGMNFKRVPLDEKCLEKWRNFCWRISALSIVGKELLSAGSA
jgi:tRNA pseudouridine38-40 synthase